MVIVNINHVCQPLKIRKNHNTCCPDCPLLIYSGQPKSISLQRKLKDLVILTLSYIIYKSGASCSGDVSRELLDAAIRGTVGSLVLFTVDVGVLDGQAPNIEIVTDSNNHGVLGTSSTTNKSLR
jgi:hypothetical protein